MSRIFGNIAQIGYVVRDIDAAMDNWAKHGVGPWFYVDRVQTDYFRYRGADSDMQMSVALANSGDVQLELIQPRNDAPSMYKDFLDAGREGMQHIAY
jgi:4-hydroxyphenylpyruvate dioxygenase-like putative hemolysin